MTACAYISPPYDELNSDSPVVPILMADTIVTRMGATINQCQPILTPVNIHLNNDGNAPGYMTRKIQILSDSLAISCAGQANRIRMFANDVRWRLDDLQQEDRPMRLLGDHANRSGIQLIGAYVKADNGINFVTPSNPRALKILGKSGCSGSGAIELEAMLDRSDEFLYKDPIRTDPALRGYRAIQFINANIYLDEIMGYEYSRWGGFVESCFHNTATQKWEYAPPTLYIYSFLEKQGKDIEFRGVRLVAYIPDQTGALIFSFDSEHKRTFFLNNLFETSFEPPSIHNFLETHTGTIQLICLSSLILENNRSIGRDFCALSSHEANLMNIQIEGDLIKTNESLIHINDILYKRVSSLGYILRNRII